MDIGLAPEVDDLDAVLAVVTQLQIRNSSSAMPGIISTSIPPDGPGPFRYHVDTKSGLQASPSEWHTENLRR